MGRFRVMAATTPVLAALILAAPALATPTNIVVRVISQGAKFVGSGMGGAGIIVRDAASGAILAQGVTTGGTGNTKRIMETAPRDAPRADATTAGFAATIDIDAPRLVEVSATGPLAQPQSAVRVMAQHWLIPGAPVVGDGWVLELPGLVVDITDPATPAHAAKDAPAMHVTAHVAMMCGCPIEPGGLWDAGRFDVRAHVVRDGTPLPDVPLTYAGTTGNFGADLPLAAKGSYLVTVSAFDRQTGAAGVDKASVEKP